MKFYHIKKNTNYNHILIKQKKLINNLCKRFSFGCNVDNTHAESVIAHKIYKLNETKKWNKWIKIK